MFGVWTEFLYLPFFFLVDLHWVGRLVIGLKILEGAKILSEGGGGGVIIIIINFFLKIYLLIKKKIGPRGPSPHLCSSLIIM